LQVDFPKTYLYLKRFGPVLSKRPGYIKYINKEPFYSLYDIKAYTFTPYKVVWREQASFLTAAVVELRDGKTIIPDHKLMLTAFAEKENAYFVSALLNSSVAQLVVVSYAVTIQMDTHVLENIRIPKFDPTNKVHQELAGLSQNAHYATEIGDEVGVKELEQRIDELAAQIWGLTTEELAEIKSSLEEMA